MPIKILKKSKKEVSAILISKLEELRVIREAKKNFSPEVLHEEARFGQAVFPGERIIGGRLTAQRQAKQLNPEDIVLFGEIKHCQKLRQDKAKEFDCFVISGDSSIEDLEHLIEHLKQAIKSKPSNGELALINILLREVEEFHKHVGRDAYQKPDVVIPISNIQQAMLKKIFPIEYKFKSLIEEVDSTKGNTKEEKRVLKELCTTLKEELDSYIQNKAKATSNPHARLKIEQQFIQRIDAHVAAAATHNITKDKNLAGIKGVVSSVFGGAKHEAGSKLKSDFAHIKDELFKMKNELDKSKPTSGMQLF